MFVKGNSLNDINSYFSKELSSKFSTNEVKLITQSFITKRLNISLEDLIFKTDILFSESDLLYFRNAIKRLKNDEPFQYVIGDTEFYGLIIKTDNRALIPRPETEELVDWVLSDYQDGPYKILDMCSGSGCIAIAIKSKRKASNVQAAELSSKAIALIEENIRETGQNIQVVKIDVLDDGAYEQLETDYDVWVCNPPYIPLKEKGFMQKNVLDYEPELALFVSNEDPLQFYHSIGKNARKYLKSGGMLYFELNEHYGIEVQELLQELGFVNIVLRKDLQGKPRMIKAQNVISHHG